MTSELQQNRYDQLIRRVGGIIGPGSKVSEALSELFPVLEVENVRGELYALGGTVLGLSARTSAGAAAVHQQIQLFNQPDSGVIMTITSCWLGSDLAQAIAFGLVNTALATFTVTQRPRDSRFDLATPILGQVKFGNSAAIAPDVGRIKVGAVESVQLVDTDDVAIITPGNGFQVTTTTVNTSLAVTFFWKERAAQPSELSL